MKSVESSDAGFLAQTNVPLAVYNANDRENEGFWELCTFLTFL